MTEDDPIQIATPEWFRGCMDAAQVLHGENGQYEFDLEKVASIVWRGLTRQKAIIGAIGSPDHVKGMISLEIDPVFYSSEPILTERFNYVRPEWRRSTFAKRLIQFAIRISDEMCIDLMIGIISDVKLEAKERLYQRLLPKAGVWFCHKANSAIKTAAE